MPLSAEKGIAADVVPLLVLAVPVIAPPSVYAVPQKSAHCAAMPVWIVLFFRAVSSFQGNVPAGVYCFR